MLDQSVAVWAMHRLRHPDQPIPNGLKFYQPELKWRAPDGLTLEQIAIELLRNREANRHICQRFGIPISLEACRRDVENYNVLICLNNRWLEYVTSGPPQEMVMAKVESPEPAPIPEHKKASRCCGQG